MTEQLKQINLRDLFGVDPINDSISDNIIKNRQVLVDQWNTNHRTDRYVKLTGDDLMLIQGSADDLQMMLVSSWFDSAIHGATAIDMTKFNQHLGKIITNA